MADSNSSLDDFFAKKDKKSKAKKKFSSSDEIAKKLEENGKEFKFTKDKEKTINSLNNLKILSQNDDEWDDFKNEKDYSGLRIQTVNFRKLEEEEIEQQKVKQEIEESKKEEPAWKIQQSIENQNGENSVKKQEEKPEVNETTTVSAPKSYVPPHLRNKKPGLQPGFKRGLKSAPALNNESEFPSLGQDVSEIADYKYVKHGSKPVESAGEQAIDLENKYNLLSEG